ncbi:hypothetical protein HYALB_00009150 [Hymenoscyphus albidus]|uniref:WD-like domain-containing protein n=1 Tax=Hymenoscyphus albidus TaxID=595503 RepID=A0A9N9PX96_9HELO|nr:hypothetical protein HYALB_00009150 [Hymenoscyphus albidus]
MQPNSIMLALASATTLLATPMEDFPKQARSELEGIHERDTWEELYREKVSNPKDSLVFYGHGKTTQPNTKPNQLRPRATPSCGGDINPNCDDDHTARNEICDKLIEELKENSDVTIAEEPRQVCYQGAGSDKNRFCCASWGDAVSGLTKGDLVPWARHISTSCTVSGVSGKLENVKVHDSCTDFCLSNRGTHC